jgi:phosphomannomutase/phosphoglucomutase
MPKNHIFGAYDIRGRYPEEINERVVRMIAEALSQTLFRRGRIVVAHDVRLSSPSLYRAVLSAFRGRAAKVVRVGLATTPMLYFLVNELKAQGGIMVTASHNPAEENGLKIVGRGGRPKSGREILKLISH